MRIPLIGGPCHGSSIDIDISSNREVFEVPISVHDNCKYFFKVQYRIVKNRGTIHAEPLYKDWLESLLKSVYHQGMQDGTRH